MALSRSVEVEEHAQSNWALQRRRGTARSKCTMSNFDSVTHHHWTETKREEAGAVAVVAAALCCPRCIPT